MKVNILYDKDGTYNDVHESVFISVQTFKSGRAMINLYDNGKLGEYTHSYQYSRYYRIELIRIEDGS